MEKKNNLDLVSIHEASMYLNVTQTTLRRWDYDGILKPTKRNKKTGYRSYSLVDLIEFKNKEKK